MRGVYLLAHSCISKSVSLLLILLSKIFTVIAISKRLSFFLFVLIYLLQVVVRFEIRVSSSTGVFISNPLNASFPCFPPLLLRQYRIEFFLQSFVIRSAVFFFLIVGLFLHTLFEAGFHLHGIQIYRAIEFLLFCRVTLLAGFIGVRSLEG